MRENSELKDNLKENVVALVGAPNTGKTTLYNWLTNSNFKTVNYPGATIEYSLGRLAERYKWSSHGHDYLVMDTPGTYSLFPKSADEVVTYNAIYDHPKYQQAAKIILVVDATQMARNLLVAKQMKEAGFSFVVALTMSDLIRKNDLKVDVAVLEKELGAPVVAIDGVLGGGIIELIEAVEKLEPTKYARKLDSWSDKVLTEKMQSCEQLAQKVMSAGKGKKLNDIYSTTSRIDSYLMHPFFGLVIFFLIMWGLFSSIYWGAAPLMDLVDAGFGKAKDLVLEMGPDTLWADFLGNGVVASFSAVLIFVPQIFILFLGIGFLEASGYLPRAATLIDKPFSKIGLSGRSFVPVLSGFACSVPAIMATRNIASQRDRWITNFIIPLMSCSARLPVYALLLGFLFADKPAWQAGFALACLYLGALVVGGLAAAILNKIIAKSKSSFFMMELPLYRLPKLKVLLKQTFNKTSSYVKRAGPAIFIFAVLIWVGSTFPKYEATGNERMQGSYLAMAGQKIEPIFKPMGVDWRVGVGLLSAFAAREVFVSSMAIMFNIEGEGDEQADGMQKAMSDAKFDDGTPIFTVASVIGLIVFFMIALQCMSTVAIQVRENGSWSYGLMQLAVFNIVAYLLAVGIVHGLRAVGIA